MSSENSDKTDSTDKITEYTALYSLHYYIIISQTEPLVKVYSRDVQGGWHFDIFRDVSQTIALKHLNCSLKLSDIYKNVVFAEAQSDNE